MSAKRKNSTVVGDRVRAAVAREIISTCQIKTAEGTPVTWTAFREVGAAPSAPADCYLCTLPDNTSDESGSRYDLRAIMAQGKTFIVNLIVRDRDVVYSISRNGNTEEVPVPRGVMFPVPARGTGADVTSVTLVFTGDMCTIEAIPTRPTTKPAPEEEPGIVMPMDSGGEPPPPLPGEDSYN